MRKHVVGKIKNYLRKLIFSALNDEAIEGFYQIYYRLMYPKEMQIRKTYGDLNPDMIFYVIRPRTDCTEGLMSLFMNVTKNIHYAQENGYEPIVDFLNYKTQYSKENMNQENAWEYFFTQPSQYSLEEVYHSKNVILSGLEIQWYRPEIYNVDFSNNMLRKLHFDIFSSINFSEEVMKNVNLEVHKLQLNYDKTLALYLRGTDYIKLKPSGHPVQPTVRQAVEIINQYIYKYNIDKIFLVTEDGEIYRTIKSIYDNRCVIVSFDSFINNYKGEKFLSHDDSIKELSGLPYQRGLNYLVKLIILSKCAYFIGGNTMGSWAACTFSEKDYVDKYVFDLGVYGK